MLQERERFRYKVTAVGGTDAIDQWFHPIREPNRDRNADVPVLRLRFGHYRPPAKSAETKPASLRNPTIFDVVSADARRSSVATFW